MESGDVDPHAAHEGASGVNYDKICLEAIADQCHAAYVNTLRASR